MERVRFPVVLFDLDGTLIDSGPMIVASMKHAAQSVLGRDIPEEVLSAAVGGPGLVAQMQALEPDRVDDLVAAYREHNEPLHDELEAFWEVIEVLPRLRAEGRRLGIVTAKRRATVGLAFARLPELEASFDVVITSDDTERHKPSPDPILAAARPARRGAGGRGVRRRLALRRPGREGRGRVRGRRGLGRNPRRRVARARGARRFVQHAEELLGVL